MCQAHPSLGTLRVRNRILRRQDPSILPTQCCQQSYFLDHSDALHGPSRSFGAGMVKVTGLVAIAQPPGSPAPRGVGVESRVPDQCGSRCAAKLPVHRFCLNVRCQTGLHAILANYRKWHHAEIDRRSCSGRNSGPSLRAGGSSLFDPQPTILNE